MKQIRKDIVITPKQKGLPKTAPQRQADITADIEKFLAAGGKIRKLNTDNT